MVLGLLVGILFFGFLITPTHAELTLDTSLSVSEQYTDNLFFTFANKREDFGTFIIPRTTLVFENKHIKLGGTYAASAQLYVNNSQANTVAHGMNLILDLPFLNRISKRLEIRVNESFNLTPNQPGFSGASSVFTSAAGVTGGGGASGLAAGGGVALAGTGGAGVGGIGGIGGLSGNSLNNQGIFTQRRTTTFQNRARILVDYNLSPRWDSNIQYSNTLRGGLQNSITHVVRSFLSYNVSDRTKINGGYSFRAIDYSAGGGTGTTSTSSQAPGNNGTSTTHSLNLGTNYQLQPTIPIIANVAVSVTKTEISTTRLNFTGYGEISKQFSDGSIGLRANQGIGSGGGIAASSTLNQNVVFTAQKSLTRMLNAFLQMGYSRNRSLGGIAINLDSYQARGGVNLTILKWLSGGVTYSYVNQESTGQFGSTAQRNQIFVGLTATPETFSLFD